MRSNLAHTPRPSSAQRKVEAVTTPRSLELVVEMAHDLRSPLSSILMLAEFMKNGESGPITETQRRQLSLIHHAALSLCSTASDVIELARDGARLTDRQATTFTVSAVLEAVRHMVLPIAAEKDVDFRVLELRSDARHGSEHAISRVLLNLCTNALKYTDRGFVELSARALDGEPSLVEFAVSDSGRGIDPKELPTLFEPFRERESQRGYRFSSSGLGLAICRKLLVAMGSTLRLETVLGRGTRFSFVLNLPVSSSATEPAEDVARTPHP
jgi:signal transduction histidine kinase